MCVCVCVCVCVFSHVRLFAAPYTVDCQAPLSMEFSRREYWSGLLFPTPGYLPDSGTEPVTLMSPALPPTWEANLLSCGCFFLFVKQGLTSQDYWQD